VIVLPNIAGSVNSRRYRDVAKAVSAFVARCQSRAIGAREQKGVMFQPLSASGTAAATIDLAFADTPEVYAGETTSSVVTDIVAVNATTVSVRFADPATRDRLSITGFTTAGDTIQFGGSGPKFKFLPPDLVTMWYEDNQNPRNTAWPRNPPPGVGGLPFRIWRQPTRGTGGGLQIPKGVAIDLFWSTLGTVPFASFMNFGSADNTVSVMFDATGKPSEIVHSGGVRTSVSAPIFLLLGEADMAGNAYDPDVSGDTGTLPADRGGANWQYGDCIWLCIDNNSGVVKSGPVAGRKTSLLASQRFVRLTIGYGSAEK
jgi:hypothetical protein